MVFAKAKGPRRAARRGRATWRVTALLPVLALAVAGCAEPVNQGTTEDGTPLINEGKLTTCTHTDYKPFQFHENGKLVGFDVDLVDRIAKDLGVRQEIQDVPFEGIQSGEALNTRQCDIAAAAITINPVREENFDFSDPYFEATQALMVRKGSGIKGLEDLRGKKLGVQLATTGETYAEKNKKANGYETVQYEDLPLSVTAVQTKQVDAVINDNSVLTDFVKSNEDLEVAAEFTTGDQYGIGVATGNKALRDKINESLRKLRQNGEYDEIYQKWFGEKPQ